MHSPIPSLPELQNLLAKGDTVEFEVGGAKKLGIITQLESSLANITGHGGVKYKSHTSQLTPACTQSKSRKPLPKFSVKDRFSFLRHVVTMVGTGISNAAIISGEGGMGKSFTTLQTLTKLGLTSAQYVLVKGNTSAKGLYNTLRLHSTKLVVFDDCDNVFDDSTALNILKGALDSHGKREVSWNNHDSLGKFEFQGAVLFITNIPSSQLDQAVRSRCMVVDVSMTVQEKLDYMKEILPDIRPELSPALKQEAYDLVHEYAYSLRNLTLRSLVQTVDCAASADPLKPDAWKQLALYFLD
jgi:hypothetical protein